MINIVEVFFFLEYEPGHEKTSLRVLAVQSEKKNRSMKFWIEVEKELFYACSENKGTDQLCSYCTADVGLCFLHYAKVWFSQDVAHIEE